MVPIGLSHISLRPQEIQSREWEKKNKEQRRTWVNSSDTVTLCILLCMCRLTLAWISSEISTKLQGMPTHLDRSSLTVARLYLMPTGLFSVRCQLATRVNFRQPPSLSSFVQLPNWRSLPTSGRIEISSPNPLSGFAPKQTKGSSAWRTTYIVSHVDYILLVPLVQ